MNRVFHEKLSWLVVTVLVLLLVFYSASQSHLPIATKLLSLKTVKENSLTVSSALELPDGAYICVLGPYTRRIDAEGIYSNEINALLSTGEFLGDEGHWTFVYGQSGKWKAEKIQRRIVDLDDFKSVNAKKFNSVCGYANSIQISKPSKDKVLVELKEKK